MVVTTIYIVRHGFRARYNLSTSTGTYSSLVPSPTGIPSDPPLTSHGVEQSVQLADALAKINDPPIWQVYSSPFYRCLQTVEPFVKKMKKVAPGMAQLEIRGDNGLGEWYSLAPFSHPHPASPTILHELFPFYSLTYLPSLIPSYSTSTSSNNTTSASSSPSPQPQNQGDTATTATSTTTTSRGIGGESPSQLHTRVATALSRIISNADVESSGTTKKEEEEKDVAILICTHAATMIAAGRVLTGVMPRDINEPDFKAFTCGLSKFVCRRRQRLPLPRFRRRRERGWEWKEEEESSAAQPPMLNPSSETERAVGEGEEGMLPLDDEAWMNGKGVAGGWDCLLNSDCTHLSGGEERGWHFSGDETVGDVEQDWMESTKKDDHLAAREKARRGKDSLMKL